MTSMEYSPMSLSVKLEEVAIENMKCAIPLMKLAKRFPLKLPGNHFINSCRQYNGTNLFRDYF